MNTLTRWIPSALLAIAVLWMPPQAVADNASVGVVLMHGKWGSPDRNIDTLASALQGKGFLVSTPEMPWSRRRSYDKNFDEAVAEVDAEVAKQREKGAKRIVIAGHSLGAAGALAYASRKTVDAIVAIAPGDVPEGKRYATLLGNDVKKAKELMAAGKGDESEWFVDLNTGNRRDNIKMTVRTYLSYFDPDGPMHFGRNVGSLKPGLAVLWIEPLREEQPLRDAMMGFYQRLPQGINVKLLEPDADHMNAPSRSQSDVVDWIETVVANAPRKN